jgi:hypothetical protein
MYKDLLSSKQYIFAGVPQGFVLGSLLFFIYVNNVAVNILSTCRLFADDNSLQQSSNNIFELENMKMYPSTTSATKISLLFQDVT